MRKAAVLLGVLLVSCGSDEPVADDRQNENNADAATRDATVDASSEVVLDARVQDAQEASAQDAGATDASATDASLGADAADDAGFDAGPVASYADVAPIFGKYCISCHAPGGAGPFSLDNYQDAADYAGAAYGMANARLMPPAAAVDPSLGPTDAELATLLNWVMQGTPEF